MRYISANEFDLVLDLHTTTTTMPICLIASPNTDDVKGFIDASSIDKLVIMCHEVVKSSLIGNCSQAISIEVNRDATTQTMLDMLCDDIMRYLEGSAAAPLKTVYRVNELIKKSEVGKKVARNFVNFNKCGDGYYPILVGENSYKDKPDYTYLGFKAYAAERTKI